MAIMFLTCARILSFGQHPDTVKAGAYVISVHDINFHNKEYTIRFWLWFLYKNKDFDFVRQLDIPDAKGMERRTRGPLYPSPLWWHFPPNSEGKVFPELLESICHS